MDLLPVVAFLICIILLALLAAAYTRGRERSDRLRWLALTLVLALVTVATFGIPDAARLAGKIGRGFVFALAFAAMLVAFGRFVLADREVHSGQPWLASLWWVLGALWLVGLVVAELLSPAPSIAQIGWLINGFRDTILVVIAGLGGLALASLLTLGIAFYDFYRTLMPEQANRALFWVFATALAVIAGLMLASGAEALIVLGMILLALGMAGATYAHLSHRLFDIRSVSLRGARSMSLALLVIALVFGTLMGIFAGDLEQNALHWWHLFAAAVLAGILYTILWRLGAAVLQRLTADRQTNAARAARSYSQQISQAIDLNALVEAATQTLNKILNVRRSGLLMVSSTGYRDKNGLELSVVAGGGLTPLKGGRVFLDETSPLYRAFAVDRKPLLQFDMESSPEFRDLEPADRRFFRSLQMRAYAPIVVENAFVGILACGAKNNDMPFSQYDLDLLDTMAQQTGVALRNARLLVDLNHLNRSMRSLNLGLESAKDELEKLDSVKTDFITIASHELRTPLAQIRGYSDILDALNSEGMLDQEQITTMIGNLRKATERMEELISAMLDVSQLDVNAMDLRFAQTTLESVVRYAIEPLTDVIKQRRLSFEARGLRGLPHIQADMQRLVQAFRNIIVNAVKFTPDGGDIQITASVQPANDETESAQVLVAIQDTGVGIPPENLELVFKKFFRGYDPSLHSTGAYKFMGAGPGLGLTIAKGVIEGHGGKIWAESPGHDLQQCPGSTFFVLLPLNPPENARRVLPFASETKAAS